MRLSTCKRIGACLTATTLLAGCTAPAQVKEVLTDQGRYLDRNFSPANLPGEVRDTITRADSGPLAFHTMVVHLEWTFDANDASKASHGEQTQTLTAAGGSFVQKLSQESRNGIPTGQQDELSYRGLIPLRTQHFSMGASQGGMILVTHSLKAFDPIRPDSTSLHYAYTWGSSVQFMNFAEASQSCSVGKPYPASHVFATFAGSARDVECTLYNLNGAVARKDVFVYLQQYGAAIHTRADLATGQSEARVIAVNIR